MATAEVAVPTRIEPDVMYSLPETPVQSVVLDKGRQPEQLTREEWQDIKQDLAERWKKH